VQVPYFNQTSKSIALYDQYNQLSIQISSGIFTSLCKLINQKGASLLDAITFVQDQRPPYFDGYATIALPDQTIQSPTTTYSYITYKTYLIAFTLSQGQNTSDLYINQIGEITNVQSISTLSILELPDNPMELGISGVDVWGKSFQHYIGTTHNKDDDSMGFDALHP
jgi:hypothetical protein